MKKISTKKGITPLFVIIALIIAIGVGTYVVSKNYERKANEKAQTEQEQNSQNQIGIATTTPTQNLNGQATSSTLYAKPSTLNPSVKTPVVTTPINTEPTVSYTDNGFIPNTITIKYGDKVKFINNSNGDMWVASNNHPTHTIYSQFDEKTFVRHGGIYEFTFYQVGKWGYHNHMNASKTGTVIVNQN